MFRGFKTYQDYLADAEKKKKEMVKTYVEGPKELWEEFRNPHHTKVGFTVMETIFKDVSGRK